VLEQIEKQLNKLINVIKVTDFADTEHVERELVLIKVAADERTRGELMNIVEIFRAKIIDVSRRSYIVEITGTEDKVAALIELLKPIGITEIVRTGKVAMFRGARLLTVDGKDKERAA
jgi:acetolactate synthase-1/3 small subunit